MNPSNDNNNNKGKYHHHHQQQQRQDSAFTFNYIYTCDIEDVLFRVKIVNLDGILPPNSKNSSQSHGSDSKSQQSYSFTTVHNHYEYNIVEDENNFTLIDNLISSDEDNGNEFDDNEATTSGIESDENRINPRQSFLHPISCPDPYHNDKQDHSDYGKEFKKKQKKKKKLNDIIFGNLNQPFRALSNHPYITCDLISNGRRLCPPQQSQYRQMINRYDWNEWLVFSLTLDTLPRDTLICFTVWDTICPGKTVAVARTSLTLFSKRGCMRKGLYDLRLFFNEDCKEYYNGQIMMENQSEQPPLSTQNNHIITTDILLSDINLTNRKHRKTELVIAENDLIPKLRKYLNLGNTKDAQLFHFNNQNRKLRQQMMRKDFDPESLEFTSTQQYFEQDLSLYPIGTGDKSKKIQRLDKLKKRYYNNQLPKRESQDRIAFAEIEKETVTEKSLSTHVFLTIEFPIILIDDIEHTAVYFEDKIDQCCQYDIIDKDIVTIPDPEINLPNLVEIKHHALARSARSGISLRDLKPNATIRNQLNAIVNYPSTQQLTSEEQDLLWKFRFYLRNQKKALAKFLKTVNWQSNSEAEQAIELMNEWSPMDVDDALELLSPYFTHPTVRKYAVSRLKEASDEDLLLYLLQLVQALKYENFQEIRQAYENELLGYQQQQQHSSLRERKSHSENTTETIMPESMKIFASTPSSNSSTIFATSTDTVDHPSRQSTQAEKSPSRDKQNCTQNDEDLATYLLNRSCQNDELANYFFWYLCVECEGAKSFGSSSTSAIVSTASTVEPKSSSSSISTNVTAYPSVMSSVATNSYLIPPPPPSIIEWENEQQKQSKSSSASSVNELSGSYSITNVMDMYMIMMRRFSTRLLCGTTEMIARRHFLLRQQDFVVKLVEIMKEIARESGNRMKKIEKLQSILESPEPQFRFNFNKNDPLPLPLNPNIRIIGVAAKEAMIYKSATMPAKLGFITTNGQIFWTIFKNGDDLRRDDLVLQMINLMDKLLRKENLDLKLTPYRVLACSSKYGFVEFIDSQSVAEVISNEGSIHNYLRKISQHNTTATITSTSSVNDFQLVSTGTTQSSGTSSSPSLSPSGINQTGISSEIMDAYIKSCAGYCVITYLLGVGDRHLDNLLMTKTGRLFHIDFGFILGRDPRLRRPPIKITREMVDAMGGMDSENFYKFCSFVRTAFLHLRRHSNLILNLFSLMVDANVPEIALEPDKTVQKVQDKFKLELNDEQAAHYITEQVEQSVRSIMPVVVDQLHKMTQVCLKLIF
ncbi:Phosphatidylinositol 3-kinase catalytic subunit type 3, partial [Dermatophagoides pteronyssinus]